MKQKIGLGGGCHWCTEGVFQSLKGVTKVDQGWIASTGEYDSFSEAVVVSYDSTVISLEVLLEIHLLTHSSTANHTMREKYRSAIYVFDDEQEQEVLTILARLQKQFDTKLITKVLPFGAFKLNNESFLNYYKTRPKAFFCTTYIEPKLQALMRTHGKYLRRGE